MDSRIKELVKNTFVFGIGLVGAKVVQFFLLPFFTNYLSTSEYGTIELIITLASLMVPIVTVQISDAVLRFGLSKQHSSKKIFQNTIVLLFFSSLFTILISTAFLFWSNVKNWAWYLCVIIIFQAFRTNLAIFAKVKDKNLMYSIDGIIYALIGAVSNIIAIKYLKLGIQGYLFSEIISLLGSLLFLFISCKYKQEINRFREVDFKLLKEMVKYSFPFIFNGISWWIANFSDRAVLTLFYPISFVGIYSVSAKIPAIITTALSMFTQAWIMSSVREYEEGNRKHIFQSVYNIYSSFLFICITVAILVVKPFLSVYIGKEFFEAWQYVPLLLVGVAFLGISNYFSGIYVAAKKNIKEVRTTIICASINIVLNFVLIPKFKIYGAVIATLVSYVCIVFIRVKDMKSLLRLDGNIKFLLFNLVTLLFMSFFLVKGQLIVVVIFACVNLVIDSLFLLRSIKARKTQ